MRQEVASYAVDTARGAQNKLAFMNAQYAEVISYALLASFQFS